MKTNLYFLLMLAMLLYCNCSKKCDCIMYNSDGYPIPDAEPVIKTMPYGLYEKVIDCSFFDDFTDSLGGFKCK